MVFLGLFAPITELVFFLCLFAYFTITYRKYKFEEINSAGLCFLISIVFFAIIPIFDIISNFYFSKGVISFSIKLMVNTLAVVYLQTYLYKVSMATADEELTKKLNFFTSNRSKIGYCNIFIFMMTPIATACLEGYRIAYRYYWILMAIYVISTAYLVCLQIKTRSKIWHWIMFIFLNAVYWALYWRLEVNYFHYGYSAFVGLAEGIRVVKIIPLLLLRRTKFSDICVYNAEER